MELKPEVLERIAALTPKQQELLARRLGSTRAPDANGSDTIPRRPAERAPLCFAQLRLWFLDQLDPGSPHYNVPMAARIRGPLDLDVLERSLTEIVRRHEALRTTFELADDEEPIQVIHERMDVPLEVTDLQHLEPAEREAAAEARVTAIAQQPFDLATGPLVHTGVIRLTPTDHILAASTHHIISDVWSIEIILQELSAIYQALVHGQAQPLPEPALQYADFAQWQREWLQGEVLERQMEYWRNQLSGDLPVLELPTDRPRPVEQEFRGALYVHWLPAPVSEKLEALSVEERVTAFTLFLAAISVLLHRYSGQTDITVGAPVSNRSRTELEGMVGYVGNTLVLRSDLSGNPTFREALRRTQETTLGAFANQDLPFEKVVEIAQPERDLSRTPLLQVVFVFRAAGAPSEGESGLRGLGEALAIDNGTTKFDLTFGLEVNAGRHRLAIEYSTDLFDEATVARLTAHLEALLAGVAADPDTPIGSLPLLTSDERRELLVDWNSTAAPFPDARCLHELFEEQAARTPGAIAATSREGGLTYAELDARANRLAHRLRALGAGPDVPVAVCLDKSLEVAVGLLGVLKAGSAYLPLDAKTPPARVALMLDDAAAPILLTQEHLAEQPVAEVDVPIVLLDPDGAALEGEPDTSPETGVTPEHLAYVIYTSGSTGRPKGVMVDHRGRVSNFHDFNTRFGVGPGDCVLALASLNFDMSAYDVFGTLMTGARIAFPDPGSERDPAHWLERLAAERVTVWHSVPALLEMLVEYAEAEGSPQLSDLRLVLLGGDWIPTTLPDRIRALAPNARVISLGGATEVSMDSTIYEIGDVHPSARSIPYGKPMANQRCYVLDANLQPVPIGVAGDLYLAGVGVGRGYVGDPALTGEKFLDSPLPEEPGRIYRTGDRAKYGPDGNLELLGRADFQIKIRGWRIEPGEIQAVLRRHPAVRDAIVVPHTDASGSKRLVAYLVSENGHPLDDEDVRDWARSSLPDYMVPSALVQIDAFPLTGNGKVDRRNLPEPPPPSEASGSAHVSPRTETERILAEVWQELLGIEEVGIDDNFFALGGDSIKTIQSIARAKKRDVFLQPKQLFQNQTIRELAAVAEASGPPAAEPSPTEEQPLDPDLLERLRAEHPDLEDAYALPPMQRQMLENAVERPTPGLYVIQADYLFVRGSIEPDVLQRAWQHVVDRYPALRTSFAWEGLDEPVQIVHRAAPIPVETHDLRGLDVEEQLARQNELVAEDRRRGFDLTRAPLVRLYLLRVDDDAYKYICCNHHIVLDGWSRAIVQQEVFRVYETLLGGETPELPPFRPFRDYVAWVRAQDLGDAEDVWRRYLDGFDDPTPLVAARGLPGATCSGPFAKQRSPLPEAAAEALQQFTRAHQITANTVIQGAWFLLLSRYTGRRDVVLGVTSSGRPTELLDIETVVGLCMNTLPVRTAIDPSQPLLPWLRRLQAQQVDLRQLEHTPLARIREWKGLSGPLFECMMVFENYPWDGSLTKLASRVDLEHPLSRPDYQVAQFEFPLRVEVAPGSNPLLIMHYYRDSFADETVAGMIHDWAEAIERMIGDAQQPLSNLVGS